MRRVVGRRGWFNTFLAMLVASLMTMPAVMAQSTPGGGKPVVFVVPLGPGSGADTITRFIAERYTAISGQPTITENRPGGDMVIAVQSLLGAPADGRTILMLTPSSVVINPVLRNDLPYDAQRDIRPVAWAGRGFAVMVTGPDSPFHTLDDVLAAARKEPGSISMANYGHHYRLGAVSLEKFAGVTFNHINYKGAAQANNDVIGGVIDVHITDIGGAMPLIESGKLRALAVTGKERHPYLPETPTIAESGFPDYDLYVWTGYGVRGDTSDEIAKAIEENLIKVMRTPEFEAFNAQLAGAENVAGTGQSLADHIAAETTRYRALVQ